MKRQADRQVQEGMTRQIDRQAREQYGKNIMIKRLGYRMFRQTDRQVCENEGQVELQACEQDGDRRLKRMEGKLRDRLMSRNDGQIKRQACEKDGRQIKRHAMFRLV